MGLYIAVRNDARPRYSDDDPTDPGSPAEWLGVAPRRLRRSELIAWRQARGERSLCPLKNPADLAYELTRAALE